jgi:undecaprenyl-diphosphatase
LTIAAWRIEEKRMRSARAYLALSRLSEYELPFCLLFNRANHRRSSRALFAFVSRLGDGVLWYGLILLLPLLYGAEALAAVTHMMLVGLVSLLAYKTIKITTLRDRPCAASTRIVPTVPPLDQYSFPSGHTLHAVAFTLVLVSYYPDFAWLTVPFTALVALSRLVLGLHYPSDVVAGALIGAAIVFVSFLVT